MNNSLVQTFSAAMRAGKGDRFRLFCALLSQLHRGDLTPSHPEVYRFPDLENFTRSYAQLAAFLGRPHLQPPDGEIDFLQRMLSCKPVRRGSIAPEDYFFLTAFTSIVSPRRVIEIGTLTGFSAAMIAAAIARRYPTDETARVDSIDINTQCVTERSQPTGFEVRELIPQLAFMVRLHNPHDSAFVRELADRDEIELAFIDADHRHPRPSLDLLRTARCVRGNGWIVLHDVRLGSIGRDAALLGEPLPFGTSFGAEWLFDYWPFRKVSAGNIGAVQVPEDKRTLAAFGLGLMSLPFEIEERSWKAVRRELHQSLGELV